MSESMLVNLPVGAIRAGDNDREEFDPVALRALGESIVEHGLMSPIVVRDMGGVYEIVAGERRFRASCLMGLEEVPCLVRELDDRGASDLMLIENMVREGLSPCEEGESFRKRLASGVTIDELKVLTGRRQDYIERRVRLMSLCKELRDAVDGKMLPLMYADVIAGASFGGDAGEVRERQLYCFALLRDCASPTEAWFRNVVGEYEAACAQVALFDGDWGGESSAEAAARERAELAAAVEEPPLPVKGFKLPRFRGDAAVRLEKAAVFWEKAAAAWIARFGDKRKAARCEDAADAARANAELVRGSDIAAVNDLMGALMSQGVGLDAIMQAMSSLSDDAV